MSPETTGKRQPDRFYSEKQPTGCSDENNAHTKNSTDFIVVIYAGHVGVGLSL